MKPLLIRVDASSRIGTGHVMRCLALAQAWQDAGGDVVFLMAESTPELNLRLAIEGVEIKSLAAPAGTRADAEQCRTRSQCLNAGLLAVDGYHFDGTYQSWLSQGDTPVLAFDDYGHARSYHADFVLNQTNCADPSLYAQRAPQTRLLLGTSYTLFRREFRISSSRERVHPAQARRLLVTLGGADPDNVTGRVINGLSLLPNLRELEVVIVLGGATRHREQVVEQFCRSGLQGRVLTNVSNMPELMTWADLAITAGGTSVWEFALLGLPCLSIVLADNQEACLAELAASGSLVNLGWHHAVCDGSICLAVLQLLDDPVQRCELSRNLSQYVDGRGSDRVIEAVLRREPAHEGVRRAA